MSSFQILVLHAKGTFFRLLVLRWLAVAKHMTVPKFLATTRPQLLLVWPANHIDSIINAGEEWLSKSSIAVTALQQLGSLGDSIFSSRIKDLVAQSLHREVKEVVEKQILRAIASQEKVGKATLILWRDEAMSQVETNVASLNLLPSRRDVTISYRSSDIQAVPVSCIVEQIELQIVAKMKSCAIAHNILEPLDAETMLSFTSTDEDLALQVDEAFLDQVAYLFFYSCKTKSDDIIFAYF